MNIMNFAVTDVICVSPSDSIDSAIDLMEDRDLHHLVVMLEGKPVGMVSDRDILLATGWQPADERSQNQGAPTGQTRVGQIMSRPVFSVSSDKTARDAARLMLDLKISASPIVDGDQLVGIVTDTDLVRWLDEIAVGGNAADQLLRREVRHLMRTSVLSVPPHTELKEVIAVLFPFHARHVVVACDQDLLGIISDRDVRRAIGWTRVRRKEPGDKHRVFPKTAADVMSREVATTPSRATLQAALRQMLQTRVHALPVVDDGRVLGIITHSDFLEAIARENLI